MIFAIVQIIGFSNSICNPIVYAFMNENFKKEFLSAVCYCIVKETLSPARRHGNSGITMMQKKAMFSGREPSWGDKGEAFSDGNIEVKLCEQPRREETSPNDTLPSSIPDFPENSGFRQWALIITVFIIHAIHSWIWKLFWAKVKDLLFTHSVNVAFHLLLSWMR